jgi:hypothetical protein
MQTNRLGLFFSPFQTSQNDKEFGFEDLSQEDKDLYTNIVNKLLPYFSERVEHPLVKNSLNCPQGYSLIFRQSKSWRNVESMFNKIYSTKTTSKVAKWAQDWLAQISRLRSWQNSLHDCIKQLQKTKDLKKTGHVSDAILNKCLLKEENVKARIQQIRQSILCDLDERKQQISDPDSDLKGNKSCQKIIQFLNDNWDHLKLFTEWAEVSLDDEKIFVQVHPSTNFDLNEQKNHLNKSIKALFLIEAISQTEIPFEYEGEEPGKIVRPTKIDVKQSHLSASSPAIKKRSSSMQLTDELIFDFPLAPKKDRDIEKEKKTISETALKLERIVKLAIKSINQKIDKNSETYGLLVSLFPLNLFISRKW